MRAQFTLDQRAVEGKACGEIVEQMIRSRSVALIPAFSSARREACAERVEVVSWELLAGAHECQWICDPLVGSLNQFLQIGVGITFSGNAEPVPNTPATDIETPQNWVIEHEVICHWVIESLVIWSLNSGPWSVAGKTEIGNSKFETGN